MIPPGLMARYGRKKYEQVGKEFSNYFIELARLETNAEVLDVGCGVGRIAVPLTSYLNESGSYCGFDIGKSGINWCNQKIATKYSNFKFTHSDILNKHYNKNGSIPAHEYKFPFADETFDFVFLISVFTHMLPRDIENYMREISRVLKHKGTCLITFFIINNESKQLMKNPGSILNFKFHGDEYFWYKEADPESAIAYEEKYIVTLFESNGMAIDNSIHYGCWCGRDDYLSFQDIIVARKD